MCSSKMMNGYLVKFNASYGCYCTKYLLCVSVFMFTLPFIVNHMLWELGYLKRNVSLHMNEMFCSFRISNGIIIILISLWAIRFNVVFCSYFVSLLLYSEDRQMTFISNSVYKCVFLYVFLLFFLMLLIFVWSVSI